MKKTVTTIKQISAELNQPVTRIDYIIKKLKIEPALRVGRTRLFVNDVCDKIIYEIMRMLENRENVSQAGEGQGRSK